MALFWTLEDLTRMRKIETNEIVLTLNIFRFLSPGILHRSVVANQASQIFLCGPQIKAISNKWREEANLSFLSRTRKEVILFYTVYIFSFQQGLLF